MTLRYVLAFGFGILDLALGYLIFDLDFGILVFAMGYLIFALDYLFLLWTTCFWLGVLALGFAWTTCFSFRLLTFCFRLLVLGFGILVFGLVYLFFTSLNSILFYLDKTMIIAQ